MEVKQRKSQKQIAKFLIKRIKALSFEDSYMGNYSQDTLWGIKELGPELSTFLTVEIDGLLKKAVSYKERKDTKK